METKNANNELKGSNLSLFKRRHWFSKTVYFGIFAAQYHALSQILFLENEFSWHYADFDSNYVTVFNN